MVYLFGSTARDWVYFGVVIFGGVLGETAMYLYKKRDDLLFCSGALFIIGLHLTFWHFGIGALVLVASKTLQSIKNNA